MVGINKKIKAFTLIESLVSFSIIAILFVIITFSFSNVMNNYLLLKQKLIVNQKIYVLKEECIKNKSFHEEVFTYNEFRIYKKSKYSSLSNRFAEVEFKAVDNSEKTIEINTFLIMIK